MQNDEARVRFNAPVNDLTADALFNVIDILSNLGMKKLHLLLHSQGGSVSSGLAIFSYLKGRNIEIITHNIGTVDSIGVVIFCAGSKRYCVPQCSFTIHRIEFSVQANASADHFRILEKHQSFDCDGKNIRTIISGATGIPDKDIAAIMLNGQVWNAETAVKNNLVHEIKSELVPPGSRVDAVVNDKGFLLDLPIQRAAGVLPGIPSAPKPPAQ